MSLIKINNKEYKAKPITFNLICDLEDTGISLADFQSKTMSFMRAYLSACIGKGKEIAGEEMEKHLISGGTFEDVIKVISTEMEESDFFRSLTKTEEAEVAESKESKESQK